ncbi:hypothetical protein [Haladaptatus halobius]|nr:hypothetical protein [Haladaptatus halobius]
MQALTQFSRRTAGRISIDRFTASRPTAGSTSEAAAAEVRR